MDGSFPLCKDIANTASMYGTDSSVVQKFLETEIQEVETGNIRIIEWRPSLNFYKEDYVKLLSLAVDFIKRAEAEKRTVAAFGKKWVNNFFKNLENIQKTVLYKPFEFPVIITGSGPSLEKSISVIRDIQEQCLIIAASSSVMALAHGGVSADIVIATDGGGWALKHIYPYFRNSNNASAFAVNLCASLPSQAAEAPFLVMNDGSFWQSIIFHELSIPSVIVPQKGTVTASAAELAMILSSANIYLAGMDLCVKDIRTHARPYGFDHLLFDANSRLTPVYSQSFIRSRQIQGGGSLDIYAAWFKKQFDIWEKRIFYMDDNLSIKNTGKKNLNEFFQAAPVNKKSVNLRKSAVRALTSALKDGKYTKELKAELVPLLFPGEKEVTERELEKAVCAYE